MPINDVEGLIEQSQIAREHSHLSDDFARRQIADDAHPAGQAEPAPHGAADL